MIEQLRQIAIFAKTIDHGSFRGAARELNLSPSVISHHISQLEQYLGVVLIYRTTRKLTLTNEGARLLEASRSLLETVEEELISIAGGSKDPSGILSITIPTVLSHSFFTNALASAIKSYPRIKLNLDFSDTRKELIADKFDIAVRLSTTFKKTRNTRKLFEIRRRVIVSEDYKIRTNQTCNPEDIRDWDWLTLVPAHNKGITFKKPNQKAIRIKPNSIISSNDANSIFKLVEAGIGIAALPEFLVEKQESTSKLKYILPDWDLEPLTAYAEWPINAPRNGLIKLIVDKMSEYSQ